MRYYFRTKTDCRDDAHVSSLLFFDKIIILWGKRMYNEPELVKIKEITFGKILSSTQIDARISETADKINNDFEGEKIVLLAVLKGGMPFAAELMKFIKPESTLEFIRASSYGSGMESCGKVYLSPVKFEAKGKNILITEDIADSGRTLRRIVDDLERLEPKSISIATLCRKPKKLAVSLRIKYNCFDIPDEFVVGFGMDYDELGRNYPAIYQMKKDQK